jgi:aminopeptidase
MKADMTGAATIVGALHGIASLQLPTKIVAVIPLCENLPSGTATKPGDVFVGMNGKSVEVDNTDAEGRLVLADALCYIQKEHNPDKLVNLATLTGAIAVALGPPTCGVFSNSNELFNLLESSGLVVGERVWRMPLWDEYKEMIDSTVADLKNVGGKYGGSCTAAAFLKEFVDCDKAEWAHMDIAGTMDESPCAEIYKKGLMTGRPTRLLIELAQQADQE